MRLYLWLSLLGGHPLDPSVIGVARCVLFMCTPRCLQRVAVRLGSSALYFHESILGGPHREDSRCRPWTRDVQRGGRPYLRGWHLFGQALRSQSPTRRIPSSRNSTRQEKEARRECGAAP